jgi:hypothetical protein
MGSDVIYYMARKSSLEEFGQLLRARGDSTVQDKEGKTYLDTIYHAVDAQRAQGGTQTAYDLAMAKLALIDDFVLKRGAFAEEAADGTMAELRQNVLDLTRQVEILSRHVAREAPPDEISTAIRQMRRPQAGV